MLMLCIVTPVYEDFFSDCGLYRKVVYYVEVQSIALVVPGLACSGLYRQVVLLYRYVHVVFMTGFTIQH